MVFEDGVFCLFVLVRDITNDFTVSVMMSVFFKLCFLLQKLNTVTQISFVKFRTNEKMEEQFLRSSIKCSFTVSGCFGGGKKGDFYRFKGLWG